MRASSGFSRATRCCSSAPPTSTARRPNSPRPKPGRRWPNIAREQHDIQKRVGEGFSLSFDWFGRSSNRPNRELTQHFGDVLEDNGLIEERTSRQVYSVDDKRFLPDRYVEGTCPYCGYEKARGDQCDNCGSLLDPVDLINPYSSVSGSRNVEIRDTRHLFLLQSKLQDQHSRLGRFPGRRTGRS